MLTKQEMFDRAVRGLRSQGYKASTKGGICRYSNDDGCRCAWGWVDPSLTSAQLGTIHTLRKDKIGVAADLDSEGAMFAYQLQGAHDLADGPLDMENRLRAFGEKYLLTWPEA